MASTQTNTYQWSTTPNASFRSRDDWSLKWWMLLAVILSFVFHGVLYVSFDTLGLADKPVVLNDNMPERLRIDPELLKDQKAIQEIPEIIAPGNEPDIKAFEPNLDAFDQAQMVPENAEIDLTPNVEEIANLVRADDPGEATAGPGLPSMAELLAPQSMAMPDLATEMAAVRREVLSKPVSEKQMLLDAGALDPGDGGDMDMGLLDQVKAQGFGGDAAGTKVQGFSNLDELLSHGGKMGGSTAPILMPTDLLFEYGSDQLAEGARLSLMKLGFLIQKNPDSIFIVEGHTDSFGGEEYNFNLSLRRAEAVVQWLRTSLQLGTDRIRAVGMGEAVPIADTRGTVEEQAINRRVEIKVRPKA